MTMPTGALQLPEIDELSFDPAALRRKYDLERDRRVRTDGQLQTVGQIVLDVGTGLAVRARDEDDAAAAARLGYLIGAVRAGAARSNGISAQLAHRVAAVAVWWRQRQPRPGHW
jgi:hypothetical protein